MFSFDIGGSSLEMEENRIVFANILIYDLYILLIQCDL